VQRYPDIDVVVPTFNWESRLAKCLSRVRSQDYAGELRLTVVDAGSTDRTLRIAHALGARILSVPARLPGGFNGTRNFGLARTTAPLVWLVDGDNLLVEDSVARDLARPLVEDQSVQFSLPETIPGPNDSRFQRWLAYVEAANVVAASTKGSPKNGWSKVDDMSYGLTNSTLIRRSALNEVGGWDQDLRVLSRLRESHLATAAIVHTAHIIHEQSNGPIDLMTKWARRIHTFGNMTPQELCQYFGQPSMVSSTRLPASKDEFLRIVRRPVQGLSQYLRSRDPVWLWGLVYPFLIGLPAIRYPLSTYRIHRLSL
jgi:glycosyltransferase involved in cell wall biosynthesis